MNKNFTPEQIELGVLRIAYDTRFIEGETEDGTSYTRAEFLVDGEWVSRAAAQEALFEDVTYHEHCENTYIQQCLDEEFPRN